MSLSSLWSGICSLLSKKTVEFTTEEYKNILFPEQPEEEKVNQKSSILAKLLFGKKFLMIYIRDFFLICKSL